MKKNKERVIWCAARAAGCPGTAAATWVMNPKAANLPIMRVRTGAAKAKNWSEETDDDFDDFDVDIDDDDFDDDDFDDSKAPPPMSLDLAGPSNVNVPAHCASTVAMAAPSTPRRKTPTNNASPIKLTMVDTTTAATGVRESLAPSKDACRTPYHRLVGKVKARK